MFFFCCHYQEDQVIDEVISLSFYECEQLSNFQYFCFENFIFALNTLFTDEVND